MRREDWVIMVMSFATAMWVGFLFLPSLSSSSPPLVPSRTNSPKEVVVSAIPACTPYCGVAPEYRSGVIPCKMTGGSAQCHYPACQGCVHAPPQPLPGHAWEKTWDSVEPDPCGKCGKIWAQWERWRRHKCYLVCKSHVFSEPRSTYRFHYDELVRRCGSSRGLEK